MKITKTIDVSHLTDQKIAAIQAASDIQKKLSEAKSIVEAVVKILRRGVNTNSFFSTHPHDMADEIEKIAKAKGLL